MMGSRSADGIPTLAWDGHQRYASLHSLAKVPGVMAKTDPSIYTGSGLTRHSMKGVAHVETLCIKR